MKTLKSTGENITNIKSEQHIAKEDEFNISPLAFYILKNCDIHHAHREPQRQNDLGQTMVDVDRKIFGINCWRKRLNLYFSQLVPGVIIEPDNRDVIFLVKSLTQFSSVVLQD